jgi:hypothetical protein
LVDSNWNIKLTNFVTEEIVGDKLRHNELKYISESELLRQKKEREKARLEKAKRGGGGGDEADDGEMDGGKKGRTRKEKEKQRKDMMNSSDESRGASEEEEDLANLRMREKNTTKSWFWRRID